MATSQIQMYVSLREQSFTGDEQRICAWTSQIWSTHFIVKKGKERKKKSKSERESSEGHNQNDVL